MAQVRDIISRCGGSDAVAEATRQSVWAVLKWTRNGIPERHWSVIRAMSGATVDELHAANEALRAAAAEPVPERRAVP